MTGLEPATPSLEDWCAIQLRHMSSGSLESFQTCPVYDTSCDLLVRNNFLGMGWLAPHDGFQILVSGCSGLKPPNHDKVPESRGEVASFLGVCLAPPSFRLSGTVFMLHMISQSFWL
jgi:hypothetical protein